MVKEKGLHGWAILWAYTLWVALAALAGVALWQCYSTLIVLATILLENPNWRPQAWNSYTVTGLARFLALLTGLLWLLLAMFIERHLRLSASTNDLWRKTGRVAGMLLLLFFLAYTVLWII